MLCFILNLRAISKYKSPGAYIWRSDLTEGYFALRGLGGCICGGAYFRNFTVCQKLPTVIEHLQWNLDITKAKGTVKYIRYIEVRYIEVPRSVTENLMIPCVLIPHFVGFPSVTLIKSKVVCFENLHISNTGKSLICFLKPCLESVTRSSLFNLS